MHPYSGSFDVGILHATNNRIASDVVIPHEFDVIASWTPMINGDNGCQRDDNFFMDELIYRLGPSRTTSTSCHRDIARVLGGGDVTKEGTGANRGVGHGGRRHGRGRHQIRSGWGEEDGDVVEEGVGAYRWWSVEADGMARAGEVGWQSDRAGWQVSHAGEVLASDRGREGGQRGGMPLREIERERERVRQRGSRVATIMGLTFGGPLIFSSLSLATENNPFISVARHWSLKIIP
jgi:hypothetical protein